jgi:hypothetical protein
MQYLRQEGEVHSRLLLGNRREKRTLGRLRRREENNIKIGLQDK